LAVRSHRALLNLKISGEWERSVGSTPYAFESLAVGRGGRNLRGGRRSALQDWTRGGESISEPGGKGGKRGTFSAVSAVQSVPRRTCKMVEVNHDLMRITGRGGLGKIGRGGKGTIHEGFGIGEQGRV